MWIALIVCSTLLAAFAVQSWIGWLRWRYQRRIDLVEDLLPLTADTPEYVLGAVEALADLGTGYYTAAHLRRIVAKARVAWWTESAQRLDAAIERNRAALRSEVEQRAIDAETRGPR